MLANIDSRLGGVKLNFKLTYVICCLVESTEIDARQQIMGLCGLLVLHYQIFDAQEKKLAKQVWDLYKKVRHSLYYQEL